jgi:hypothetical protein
MPPDDEAQEPLALLVVHAAFHMLFLPQFTCDFHEEEKSGMNSQVIPTVTKTVVRSATTDGDNDGISHIKITADQLVDRKREEEKQLKKDLNMRVEAGLGEVKYVENGISIIPKPTQIVWAPGCGVSPTKVSVFLNL